MAFQIRAVTLFAEPDSPIRQAAAFFKSAGSEALFASAENTSQHGDVDPGRCREVAHVIRKLSLTNSQGFGNFYFGALARCPAGSPFFPAAYHAGGPPGFALALESAGLAEEAVLGASSLAEAGHNPVQAIVSVAGSLESAAGALAAQSGIDFAGVDFSLAPGPSELTSLGKALEELGLSHLGAPSSSFTAAILAQSLDRSQFRRCGFSGLMFLVFEDRFVGGRAARLDRRRRADYFAAARPSGGHDTVQPGGTRER